MGTTRRSIRSYSSSLYAAYLILAHVMGGASALDGASASSSRGTSSDWFRQHHATKSIISSGMVNKSVCGQNTWARANVSFLSKHQPCCFSYPPSRLNKYYSPPSTSMSTSSPIIASLFFKNLWRRRPRRSSVLPSPRGLPTIKDAPTSPSYLDMEQEIDEFDTPTSLQLPLSINQGGALDEDDNNNDSDISSDDQEVESSVQEVDEEGTNDISDMNPSDNEERKILINKYQHHLLKNATNSNNAITNAIFNVHKNEELTLMGIGMHPRQFAAWVHYYLLHMGEDGEVATDPSSSVITQQHQEKQELLHQIISKCITTQEAEYDTSNWEECIPTIREYWKAGQLICEHTHLLSSNGHNLHGKSANKDGQDGSEGENDNEKKMSEEEQQARYEEDERQYKHEQFRDVLGSYAERMASIVEDEKSDSRYIFPSSETGSETSDSSGGGDSQPMNFGQLVDLPNGAEVAASTLRWNTQHGLRGWIETEYGVEKTQLLLADTLLQTSEEEQLKTFQSFLDWFREHFPYFHDKCDSCGASCKDDPAPPAREQVENNINDDVNANHDTIDSANNEEANGEKAIEQIDEDDFSFLGYVYPTPGERLGNASRTELYRCRSCSSFTRFPRYNKALWVTSTKRGRCGEYSMLLYRMLRSLGYEKLRWVVDWADHVWVEVWLGDQVHSSSNVDSSESGRWVHLDPCEAAVDIPLLYESWGKNQTFIVAFHDPTLGQAGPPPARKLNGRYTFPPVEDRTRQYTSDGVHVIQERRGISEEPVADAIGEVSKKMVHLLEKMMERR